MTIKRPCFDKGRDAKISAVQARDMPLDTDKTLIFRNCLEKFCERQSVLMPFEKGMAA